jgi:glutamate synthase domain-containing protein 3
MEEADLKLVRNLVLKHATFTSSPKAKWILKNWSELLTRFVKVFPHEYKRVLGVPRAVEKFTPVMQEPLAEPEVQHG